MKPLLITLLVAVLIAGGASYGTIALLGDDGPEESPAEESVPEEGEVAEPGEEDPMAQLTTEEKVEKLIELVGELRADQAEMKALLGKAKGGLAAPNQPQGDRIPVGNVEDAVAEALAKLLPKMLAKAGVEAGPMQAEEFDIETVLAFLGSDDADWLDKEEMWQRLREEGNLDAVIDQFEALAAEDPTNPDLQVDLGYAYIQKIQDVGNSPLAGKWASMADEAFDKALELNPDHWDARYTKAISLSHWPDFTGKKNDAISELETLVGIQGNLPPEPYHAQTYLVLGNLYSGQGKNDLAQETWQKGLDLFPGDDQLSAKLAGN